MPPKRGGKRTRTVRVRADAREVVDEQGAAGGVQAEGVQHASPQFDQAALMQMVQQAATQAAQTAIQQVTQEAARVAAQEATRVAAQEVARQLAAGQQIPPQEIPPQQIPPQQDPPPQMHIPQVPVQGVPGQQLPQGLQQPLPVYRAYDERFYRLTSQMRNMDMEHFGGTVDATVAHDWKLSLQRKLEIIECPPEASLRLAMQYLRGDALVWWEGVRLGHPGPDRLTFADFIREFDRKYFPKEAMDKKKSDFEHVSQGDMTIREYELEFNRLRRFAGGGITEEDLIRKFLSGMRVEIRNRCRVVTYYRLGDLVEKAAEQEAGLAEEQKLFKSTQPKVGKTLESQKRTLDELEPPSCTSCKRNHYGECIRCHSCGRTGHMARNCRFKPLNADSVRQIVEPRAATMDCFNCGQPGHIFRDCPRREHAEDSPPPKRQAIDP
ncbi:uncharacterized protein LOC103845505 [Brassica rapa]|uniref:uncharacterized protein LOC106369734 n=1 Tax=Brassica napus TaxID=3708 RepID=UPI00142E12D0|nr:uncharacterized protein LOC106369734 [Brassica napus]XP_033138026.1 uncharacterized protein LOC103845505 [Brassica rapa]XP_033138027.1 uncharacterized protein LOC103845505 [Brassica rapa]XP_033138028.1 uncharacterized protein LOC103845505 [Brassica rapa]XP_033138029.1 uncharacterized protein LOC103845505 [Brassica rapa]XP_033138030.1 uncharacterized protein LOC103845505 [Brassica rapa]XP_033138031.1 uncharacterized protein LOC103845505 [Brassica rapa]XP_033138032.1 uncharacterized protein